MPGRVRKDWPEMIEGYLLGRDALRDGVLRYMGGNNDRDVVLQQIGGLILTSIFYGYHPSDINLDGEVRYSGAGNDRDIILLNIGGVVPTAIRLEQVP